MALFTRDGDLLVPSAYTTGPWRPDAQHGGPPSALIARAIESVTEPGEFVARITIELVKPVPLAPLQVTPQRQPVSRRVAHVAVEIAVDDVLIATGLAMVLRGTELPPPRWAPQRPAGWDVAPPEAAIRPPAFRVGDQEIVYHRNAVEHRMTRGGFAEAGPATSWVSLKVPLVEGEDTSPLCSVLAAADFGSGISAVYWQRDDVGLINADLTVAFSRPPVGEWVRVSSETRTNNLGAGLAITELGDQDGPMGIATQSLLGLTS